MLDFIMVPAILAIIGTCIYRVFELFTHRKERLLIIEKMSELSNVDSNFKVNIDFFSKSSQGVFTSLKFALFFCGLGLGLLIGFYMMNTTAVNLDSDKNEILLGASTLFFGGLGLLFSFFIELYLTKKEK